MPAAQAGRLDLLRHAQERLKAWAPLLQRFLKSEDDQARPARHLVSWRPAAACASRASAARTPPHAGPRSSARARRVGGLV